MLQLNGPRRRRDCDGSTRRDFLKIGTLAGTGVALPDLLRARAAAKSSSRNTSVVWLWLGGGPTHVETFDPKMSAPAEYRSVTGAVNTTVPGIDLGANFTKDGRGRRQDGVREELCPPQQRGWWRARWCWSGPRRWPPGCRGRRRGRSSQECLRNRWGWWTGCGR